VQTSGVFFDGDSILGHFGILFANMTLPIDAQRGAENTIQNKRRTKTLLAF